MEHFWHVPRLDENHPVVIVWAVAPRLDSVIHWRSPYKAYSVCWLCPQLSLLLSSR